MARHVTHESFVPDDDARLRAAQELVAGEKCQRHACSHALLGHRFVGKPEVGGVQEAAAPQIVHYRNVSFCAQPNKFLEVGRMGEP